MVESAPCSVRTLGLRVIANWSMEALGIDQCNVDTPLRPFCAEMGSRTRSEARDCCARTGRWTRAGSFCSRDCCAQVRGCRGAVVLFKTGVGEGEVNAATLVLGSDAAFTNLTFRNEAGEAPVQTHAQTPLLLSCDSYR